MELKRYWDIINRRKILFIVIVGLALGIALAGPLLYQTLYGRVYYIPLRVQILKQDFGAQLVADAPADFGKLFSENYFRNVFAIAKSEPVTQRVIDKLGLKDSKGKPYSALDFMSPGIGQVMSEQRGVTIKSLTETEILEIWGISKDPHEAARIARAYGEELGNELSDLNREMAKNLVSYYETEIPRLTKEVKQAEAEALAYQVKYHLADSDTYRGQLINTQVSLENTIQSTERGLKENILQKQATLAQIKKQPELRLESRSYSANPYIQSLKQSLLDQERSLAVQLLVYTEDYPDVKATKNRIETLRGQLKQEVEKTFSQEQENRNTYLSSLLENLGNMEINDVVSKARLGVLTQQKNDIIGKLDDLSAKELGYKQIMRKVGSLQERLSSCYSQLEASRGIEASHITNIAVLAPVQVPTDKTTLKSYTYFPKKKKILLITLILAIGAGVVFVFLADYLEGKGFSEEEFRSVTGLPVIGTVPRLDSTFEPITKEEKEYLKEIVADWTLKKSAGGARSICLLSPQSGDGRTSAALALARIFQSAGHKVSLVPGGNEHSLEMINVAGIEYRNFDRNLGMDPEKLQSWLKELELHTDVVIIDTPAMESSRLGLHLAKGAGITYLVCRSGRTKRASLERAGQLMKDYKVESQGILLNQYSG